MANLKEKLPKDKQLAVYCSDDKIFNGKCVIQTDESIDLVWTDTLGRTFQAVIPYDTIRNIAIC